MPHIPADRAALISPSGKENRPRGVVVRMMAMTGPLPFSGERAAGRMRRVGRWFVAMLIRGEYREAEREVFEYLQRHQHDLPPELRITLERRFLGP